MSICLFAGLSVHLSIRPHETTPLPLDGFALNLIFEYFRKSVEKIQVTLKSDKNNGYSAIRPKHMFHHVYPQLFLEFEMFQTKVVVTTDTNLCSITYCLKHCAIYEIMWKTVVKPDRPQMTVRGVCNLRAGNLRLQTSIFQLFNTYYFSTATMVVRTHMNVTLYAHCLSWFILRRWRHNTSKNVYKTWNYNHHIYVFSYFFGQQGGSKLGPLY
jgi:hypothetical protein